jgi:hypothetical protein
LLFRTHAEADEAVKDDRIMAFAELTRKQIEGQQNQICRVLQDRTRLGFQLRGFCLLPSWQYYSICYSRAWSVTGFLEAVESASTTGSCHSKREECLGRQSMRCRAAKFSNQERLTNY